MRDDEDGEMPSCTCSMVSAARLILRAKLTMRTEPSTRDACTSSPVSGAKRLIEASDEDVVAWGGQCARHFEQCEVRTVTSLAPVPALDDVRRMLCSCADCEIKVLIVQNIDCLQMSGKGRRVEHATTMDAHISRSCGYWLSQLMSAPRSTMPFESPPCK